jgi:hypothetical protein
MEGLTDSENVILGVASASNVAVTLQPTIYWKNAAAQGLPFTLRPSLLFRGCGVNLLKESSEMALQFAVAGRMKSNGGGHSSGSAAREMGSAVGGGAFGALLVTPFECVMIQQQLHGTSLLTTPSLIARRFGLLSGGLYRGFGIAASRDAIYVGGMLGLAPVVRRYLVRERPVPFPLFWCANNPSPVRVRLSCFVCLVRPCLFLFVWWMRPCPFFFRLVGVAMPLPPHVFSLSLVLFVV